MAHPEDPLHYTEPYLRPHDVARIYNVSYRTVLQWIHTGELEAYRVARKMYRVPPEALDHLAQPVVRDLGNRNSRHSSLQAPRSSNARPTRSRR